RLFDLPDIALRLWGLPDLEPDSMAAQAVSPAIQADTDERSMPWCGPADGHETAQWLATMPESLALLPLKIGTPGQTLGLLVLGSPDPERFTSDMGTEFLQTLSTLA